MKYRKTFLNRFVLYATLVSILFFVLGYEAYGSGPWDVYVYLLVGAVLSGLLIIDYLWQFFRQ